MNHPAQPPSESASPERSSMSESERVIRYLYRITADSSTTLEYKIQHLLQLGCSRFDMEIGIVAEVSDDTYTIRHFRAPADMALEKGLTLDLQQTLGPVALGADSTVTIEDLRHDYANHPARETFGLQSYIGCPVRIGEEGYGTLSFSSRTHAHRTFREVDKDALQLMATWLGAELHRQRSTDELHRLNTMLMRYKKALEAANQQLREQNRLDELTGIANRRTVLDELRTLVIRAARTHTPLTVIAIDADNFKAINDTHGHAAGDRTLKRIARVLVDLTREGDMVGRLGGEEFMVLLPNTDSAAAVPLAERLRAGVAAIHNLPMTPSISLGIAAFEHRNRRPINVEKVMNTLLMHADQAMYRAKHEGKNRVCVAAG